MDGMRVVADGGVVKKLRQEIKVRQKNAAPGCSPTAAGFDTTSG